MARRPRRAASVRVRLGTHRVDLRSPKRVERHLPALRREGSASPVAHLASHLFLSGLELSRARLSGETPEPFLRFLSAPAESSIRIVAGSSRAAKTASMSGVFPCLFA